MSCTCDTCRFFEPDANSEPLRGSCARWHKGYGIDPRAIADNEVLVEDDEWWGMVMGPKFGCVLHEPLTHPE